MSFPRSPIPKELEELKKKHEGELRYHIRRELNRVITELLIPQGLETVVEVAVGLDRRPILISVLEEKIKKLKQDGGIK